MRWCVYVENFFEAHWLEKARFGRKNVPWASVEFVREGSLLAESPDLPHPLRIPAGSLLWIPPIRETLLRTGPEGFCRKVSLTLCGALLADWQKKCAFLNHRVLPQIDRKRFELLLEDFRQLSELHSEEALRANGVTSWKLLQFLRNPRPIREIPESFQKVLEKLRQNLDRPIPLKLLADEVRCTPIHLVRAFRNYFGETPHRMRRNLRMRLAADLLLNNPDLSIKEIAAPGRIRQCADLFRGIQTGSRRISPSLPKQPELGGPGREKGLLGECVPLMIRSNDSNTKF